MITAPPAPEEPLPSPDQGVATRAKPRSTQDFLRAGSATLAIGIGVLGVAGLAAWLARNDLATAGLNAFLRSKGVPADVKIKNLQLDTAQIVDLRLGPQDNPSLLVKNTIIQWRVDSKARLFIIERLQADDVTIGLTIDQNGKPDLGALAPLLKPSSGPKRSVINNVTISNATLLLNTPLGLAKSKLHVIGGEATGWTGLAQITPPASLIAKTGPALLPFEPLRLGFAFKQVPSAGPDTKPATLIGFAARPNGQSLAYQDMLAQNIMGDVTGQVTLNENSLIRIDTRPVSLKIGRASAQGLDLRGLAVTSNPIFWSHATPWQRTGWGNIVVTGSFDALAMAGAGFQAGPARFQIGAARAQSGRTQLDYQGDVQRVAGAITAQRMTIAGNISTRLDDLTQFSKATLTGKAQAIGVGVVLPTAAEPMVPPNLPPAIQAAVKGTFSGSGGFDYLITPAASQVSLSGPLVLTGSTGLRANLIPTSRAAPTVLITKKPNGAFEVSAMASGRALFALPGLGNLQGDLDGVTFGPRGWAAIGRDVTMGGVAVTPSLVADVRFDRLDLQGPKNGPINGRGNGQIVMRATPPGTTKLVFDLTASPSAISGTVGGPVDGFGAALGLGGYGVRAGTIALRGTAQRRGGAWVGDGSGQLTASAFSTNGVLLSSPTLSLGVEGQFTDQNILSARVQFLGKATEATPAFRGNRATFGGLAINGRASLNGSTTRLTLDGNLESKLARTNLFDLQLDQTQSNLQFAGTISPSSAQIRGTNSISVAALKRRQKGPSGQVSISGLRSSGPFTVAATGTGTGTAARPSFWDGRLTLTSDVELGLERLLAGSTRLSDVEARIPIIASLSPNRAWQAQGRLTGRADLVSLASTTFADLSVSGPFDAQSTNSGWQAKGDVDLVARTLIAGDTRLNGLTAEGPLDVTSANPGNIRISSAQCLNFAAASGRFPGDAAVEAVSGKLCPNATGEIAVLGQAAPRLFATTQLDPLTIQIGDLVSGQRIDLGEVSGTFASKPDGSLNIEMLATQFGLSLKLPDGNTAQIKADEAALTVSPQANGIGLKGRIGGISSLGLPVLLSGSATADLVTGSQGLAGTFVFDDIIVKDAEKSTRFGELRLVGSGTLAGNQVSILSDVLEPASEIKMGTILLSHDIGIGSGNLDLTARDILFSPQPIGDRPGLDIVTLVPPLRGVVSDMIGVANASANVAWSRNAPMTSRTTIETKGLDFATMLGPITGFAGDIRLDDLLLVRTAGLQTIKIGLFDPGLPIENGTVQFVLPGDNSLRLQDASWPFADGILSVRPATWAFRDGDQSFAIDVENVDLAKLLRLTDVPNLEIDGKVSGVFPIEVREGNVEIVGGRLKAREGGGVIRFTGPNPSPSPPPPPPGFFGAMRQRFMGKPPVARADLAFEALRALEYKILEITVDGRITGELKLGVVLEGANQQVLSGQPFKFNVKMNVPIGQLLDNVNNLNNIGSSPEVLKEIDRMMREEAAAKATPPTVPPVASPPPPPSPAP